VSTSLKFVSMESVAYHTLSTVVDTIRVSSVMTGETKIPSKISGLNHPKTSQASSEEILSQKYGLVEYLEKNLSLCLALTALDGNAINFCISSCLQSYFVVLLEVLMLDFCFLLS